MNSVIFKFPFLVFFINIEIEMVLNIDFIYGDFAQLKSLGFSTYTIILSVNKGSFTFSFTILVHFLSFFDLLH